jgi:hypothetical protein
VEGDNTPQWNSDGYVTGLDNTGTMIGDMKRFLDAAGARDIVVIPVLWNAALMRNQKVVDLHWDDAKLQSYIDKALIVSFLNITGIKMLSGCLIVYANNAAAGFCSGWTSSNRRLGSHERT